MARVPEGHWDVLAAADFFSVEVWTATGLKRYAVLFVIELATRRVQIAGIASEPDSAWVVQCGRQLTDAVDGLLVGKRFLLHDRDPLFSDAFRETLAATGVETVRLPPRAPNLNAHAERYVRTIKEAYLNRMIFVGEWSLRRAITEFVTHYHYERNHQGLGNLLIFPARVQPRSDDRVVCRERLGGLLKVLPPTGRVGAQRAELCPDDNCEKQSRSGNSAGAIVLIERATASARWPRTTSDSIHDEFLPTTQAAALHSRPDAAC